MMWNDDIYTSNTMKKSISIAFLITFLGMSSAQASTSKFDFFHGIIKEFNDIRISLLQSSTEKRNTPGTATGGENLSVVNG
jgi:hypothetical protein